MSDDGTVAQPQESDGDADRPTPRRGFFRRHKLLTGIGVLVLVVLLATGGAFWWLNSKLGDIPRSDFAGTLEEENRPPKDPEAGDALNIVIAGVDSRESDDFSALLESGDWQAGAARSDTNMVLHIPEDRDNAYLVSIPRDSYVDIYDEHGDPTGEKHKINYAFSIYGPAAHISTVEHLTGLRMDHMAVVNWAGFKDITEALGGVTVYIPETLTDPKQNVTWQQGELELDPELALKYVRTRYALPNGDFGRIQRQQNFLRAMFSKLVSRGTLTDLPRLNDTLNAVTKSLVLDQDWSNGDLRGLAFAMRDVRTADIEFLTVPLSPDWNQSVEGDGSVVILDRPGMNRLFAAMSRDDMDSYQPDNPEQVLPDPDSVN